MRGERPPKERLRSGNAPIRSQREAAADGAVFDTAFRLLQAGLPLRVARKVLVLPLHRGTATVAIEPESG